MVKLFRYILYVTSVLGLSSCFGVYICTEGSGHLSKQSFETPKFNKIYVNITSKVFILQDSVPKIEVETDDNLFNYLMIGVNNGELIIDSEKGICPRKLNVYISNPVFNKIVINGSADLIAQSPINAGEFSIVINGSGDVSIDSVNANEIVVSINGSGDVKLGGTAENLWVQINGSGDVRAMKLLARNVYVETNGSGDAIVNSLERLKVDVTGSGDVQYLGNPRVSEVTVSGSGSARRYLEKSKIKDK